MEHQGMATTSRGTNNSLRCVQQMNFSLGVHANESRHCLSSPEPAQVHLDNSASCHEIIPILSQGKKMIEEKVKKWQNEY